MALLAPSLYDESVEPLVPPPRDAQPASSESVAAKATTTKKVHTDAVKDLIPASPPNMGGRLPVEP